MSLYVSLSHQLVVEHHECIVSLYVSIKCYFIRGESLKWPTYPNPNLIGRKKNNITPQLVLSKINNGNFDNNYTNIIISSNSINNNNNPFPPEQNPKGNIKYTKVLVEDPINNRNIILKLAKKQKGAYV